MICPVCNQEMTPYKQEPCHNSRTNAQYQRTRYRCEKDDVWGRLEVPIAHDAQAQQHLQLEKKILS